MKRLLPLLLLVPLLPATTTLAETAPATTRAENGQTLTPVVLVHITRLTGTGPDGAEHVLFEDSNGFVTTLDTLGRVGYQVSARGLAEGGYHTLFVELADRYEVISHDGIRLEKRFSESGRETRRRIRGMIMVQGGEASPLRMLEDPSYYGSMRSRGGDDDD
jgi:hypothetical protein